MAFRLLNPDDHPLAIQIGQVEGAEFGEPEPGGIKRGEDSTMLQIAWGHKDGSDIGVAENRGACAAAGDTGYGPASTCARGV